MTSEQQVEAALKSYEDVDSWKTIIFLYNAALKEVGTKLEILNDEFQHVHQYNPIEHIKTRIKTPESIVKKLRRYGHETSIENMVRYINDIAGVRLICSFTSDIYRLAEMIGNQSDLKVLSIKDYIKNPKPSGYRSLHLIVQVPIFLQNEKKMVNVEVQFRTIAMDFWASLDHKMRYKKELSDEEVEILQEERYKELFFENIRWYDICRWGILEQELAKYPSTKAGTVHYDPQDYYLPIPESELRTNPLMKQSKGY